MRVASVLSSLVCIAAGVYLLQTQAVGESSWFEAIAHGMGIYFIGKGIYVGASLMAQAETARHTRTLVEIEEVKRQGRATTTTPAPADAL